MVRYLHERGRRRIGFIGGKTSFDTRGDAAARGLQEGGARARPAERPHRARGQAAGVDGAGRRGAGGDARPLARRRRHRLRLRSLGLRRARRMPAARHRRARPDRDRRLRRLRGRALLPSAADDRSPSIAPTIGRKAAEAALGALEARNRNEPRKPETIADRLPRRCARDGLRRDQNAICTFIERRAVAGELEGVARLVDRQRSR